MVKNENKLKRKSVSKLPEKSNLSKFSRYHYLIIVIFTFILYGNTIPNDYSLDDNLVVLKNVQVMKGLNAIPEIFTSHYRESERNEYGYRPIAKITYAIESEFYTQNPHVSHFINVLLYALLLILLFKLLNQIFLDIPLSVRFIIVLLFASHPLHTEVVASLKNREELLCSIFGMGVILFLIKGITQQKNRIIMIFSGIFCLALSILSKQTGMIFCLIILLIFLQFYYKPLNMGKIINPENKALLWKYLLFFISSIILGVLWHYLFLGAKGAGLIFFVIIPIILLRAYFKHYSYKKIVKSEDKALLYRYIFLALFSLVIIILGYSFYKVPEVMLPSGNKPLYGFENPLFVDNTLYNRICMGFMGLLYYFKLVLIPWPLSFYYGYNILPLTGISDYRVILSVLIHLILLSVGIYYFYKNKIISFGILFYILGLLMFANWFTVIPGIIGERLIFLSSFGFCIVIGGVILMIMNKLIKQGKIKADKLPRTVYILTSLIILIYSVQTIARNRDWENHITLYKADIVHLENSAKANSMYAEELMCYVNENIRKNKHVDKSIVKLALKHYMKSTEVYPGYSSSYNNIGTIYIIFFNDYLSAVPYFEKAFSFDSLNSECIYNLAYAYEKSGDTLKALKYYEKAVRKDSLNINMISGWANLLNNIGDMNRAIDLNMHIIKIKPSSDLPYINIGNYYIALKDTTNAVKYWEKAIAIIPVNDNLNTFLASYFMKEGDNKKYILYSSKIGMKKKGID